MEPIEKRREIRRLKASQNIQDELLSKDDISRRRTAWVGKLRSAARATRLYQEYRNSADRFTMTFAEFRKRHAKQKPSRTNW